MSIGTYLEKIISSRFGKDVRQAMHDAIKQVYDDAAQQGNTNMEVLAARGSFPVLNDRLNATDDQIGIFGGDLNDLNEWLAAESAKIGDIQSLGNLPRDLVQSLLERGVNVKDYGAIGDGNSHPLSEFFPTLELAQMKFPIATSLDDEIDWCAIQTVINKNRETGAENFTLLPYGEYVISKSITYYRYTRIYGVGKSIVSVIARANSNIDLFVSYKFSAYKGTNITGSTEEATNLDVPIGFELLGFTIDGNFDNNNSGYGLKLYGKKFQLNLRVIRCADVGVYTEYGANSIYNAEDIPESEINLEIHETGGESFIFNGASDVSLHRVFSGWAGKKYADSKVFPGRKVDNVVIMKGCEIGTIHAFENEYGRAIRFTGFGSRITAHLLIAESAHGCLVVEQGVRIDDVTILAHSNRSNVNPYVELDSDIGIEAFVDIRKVPTDGLGTMLHIKKENVRVRGFLMGNASGGCYGNGLIHDCHHSKIDLDIRYLLSDPSSPTYAAQTNYSGGKKRNEIKLKLHGCTNSWNNLNKGASNKYDVIISNPVGGTAFTGQKKNQNREIWNVMIEDSASNVTKMTENQLLYNNCINLTAVNETEVPLQHFFIYTPELYQVQMNLIENSTHDYDFLYLPYVSRVDVDYVYIKFKMKTPSPTSNNWASVQLTIR